MYVFISNITLFQILSIPTSLYELNFLDTFDRSSSHNESSSKSLIIYSALKPNAQCTLIIFWIDQILLGWPHHSRSNGVRRWGAFKQAMQQMSDLCLYAS